MTKDMVEPQVSIVIPTYNELENVEELFAGIKDALDSK